MKKRPYTSTGDRLKSVRASIPGLTQRELADKIGCTTDYVAMLERGEKPLTEGMAYKISKECGVATDYLLLKSDNMYASAPIDILAEHEKSIVWNYFINFICSQYGYEIERVQSEVDISSDLKSRITCIIRKGSNGVKVSSGAIADYIDDISDYAKYKLDKMLEKEASRNG